MTLKFIEDVDQDVKNWQASLAKHSDYVGDPVRFLPKNVPIEKISDTEYLKRYLLKNFYAPGKITEFKNWLSANVHIDQIQKDPEDLMEKTFTAPEIKAYITVFGLGRYNPANNLFYIIYKSQERESKISGILPRADALHFP